ncbi:hypothetical protein EW145_g828 [Phellinidium pouzarii]|uniref:NudC domain-containing protein 1 n=1 Tax=Phellinidium pouzarii TaxID=167371 RepID=A0A4S4LGT5_9AGAM|nr:hypothetical protein EW145_g828 [Phellinidium pouzarii]
MEQRQKAQSRSRQSSVSSTKRYQLVPEVVINVPAQSIFRTFSGAEPELDNSADDLPEQPDVFVPLKSSKGKDKAKAFQVDDYVDNDTAHNRTKSTKSKASARSVPVSSDDPQDYQESASKRSSSGRKRRRAYSPVIDQYGEHDRVEAAKIYSPPPTQKPAKHLKSSRRSAINYNTREEQEAGPSLQSSRRRSHPRPVANDPSCNDTSRPPSHASHNEHPFSFPFPSVYPTLPEFQHCGTQSAPSYPHHQHTGPLPNFQDPSAQYHLAQALQSLSVLMGGAFPFKPSSLHGAHTPHPFPTVQSPGNPHYPWPPYTPRHCNDYPDVLTPQSAASAPPTSSPVGSNYSDSLPSSPIKQHTELNRSRSRSISRGRSGVRPRSAIRGSSAPSRSRSLVQRRVSFSSPEAIHIEDVIRDDNPLQTSSAEDSDDDTGDADGRPNQSRYKLAPVVQDELVVGFPLSAYLTQANVSGRTKTPLSFEEVQSRITHNHLAIAHDGQSALYIDGELNVIRVVVNSNLTPTFNTLCELPKLVQSDELLENLHKEYPSAESLPGCSWLISDGNGWLYILKDDSGTGRISAVYQLQNEDDTAVYTPFRIHAAHLNSSDNSVLCMLSCRHTDKSHVSGVQSKVKTGNAQFDVCIVNISLNTSSEETLPLNIIWHGRGSDVPVYARFDESRKSFFILGSSLYRQIGNPIISSYEPTREELAPIPRAGEVLPDTTLKPPPYSWTQTSDSVTVAFPLPSNVSKSAIKVTLTAKTLSLFIKHELPVSVGLPRYSLKQLWDVINPSTSFWTWDREGDKHVGLLTLHLDKQHEGTRWSHVFASVGTAPLSSSATADPTDEEVPETLDPSELYQIRESLEKYTNALQTGEDASGLGLGQGMPSLAEGELDDTVDGTVGRPVVVTWVEADGTTPGWAMEEDMPTYLLSTSLPGLQEGRPSLVVRNDIDGLLFSLPLAVEGAPSTKWEHIATYPALSFVLASKQDTRFRFHMSSKVELAFESGTGAGGGNVFIYRGNSGKEKWAKQAILRITSDYTGALLGVGAVKKDAGGISLHSDFMHSIAQHSE